MSLTLIAGIAVAGKSTLIDGAAQLARHLGKDAKSIPQLTTREKRPNDTGNYRHVSRNEFQRLHDSQKQRSPRSSWAYKYDFNGEMYAIPEWHGLATIGLAHAIDAKQRTGAILIGIDADDDDIRSRIKRRDWASESERSSRLARLEKDREMFETIRDSLDYLIINNDPEIDDEYVELHASESGIAISAASKRIAAILDWIKTRRGSRDYASDLAKRIFGADPRRLEEILKKGIKPNAQLTLDAIHAYAEKNGILASPIATLLPVRLAGIKTTKDTVIATVAQHPAPPGNSAERERITGVLENAYSPHLQRDGHGNLIARIDDRHPATLTIRFAPIPGSVEEIVQINETVLRQFIKCDKTQKNDLGDIAKASREILDHILTRKISRWRFERDDFPYGIEANGDAWTLTDGPENPFSGCLPDVYAIAEEKHPDRFSKMRRAKTDTLFQQIRERLQTECTTADINTLASSMGYALQHATRADKDALQLVREVADRLCQQVDDGRIRSADERDLSDESDARNSAAGDHKGRISEQSYAATVRGTTPFLMRAAALETDSARASRIRSMASRSVLATIEKHLREDGSVAEIWDPDTPPPHHRRCYGASDSSCHAYTLAGLLDAAIKVKNAAQHKRLDQSIEKMISYLIENTPAGKALPHDFHRPNGPRDTSATMLAARCLLEIGDAAHERHATRLVAATLRNHLDTDEKRPHVLLDSYSGGLSRTRGTARTAYYAGGCTIYGTWYLIDVLHRIGKVSGCKKQN